MRQKMRRKQKKQQSRKRKRKEQTSAEQPAEQKTDTVKKQMPQRDAEKTQKAPDQTEKQQKVTAQKEQPEQEQEQEPDAPKKHSGTVFRKDRISSGKTAESCQPSAADSFPAVGTSVPSVTRAENPGRQTVKKKVGECEKFFRSKMFREALLHAKKEVLYFLKKAAPKKVTGTVRF